MVARHGQAAAVGDLPHNIPLPWIALRALGNTIEKGEIRISK